MSRRLVPSPVSILWIGLFGGLLLGTWLVAGVSKSDVHRDGRPEVSAVARLPVRLLVLSDAIMPSPMPLCDGPCLQPRGLAPAGDGPPPSADVQHPSARGPPPVSR
jgi:hypothetical protein